MTGYQGWFRTPDDGSGSRWVHWGKRGRFDPEHVSIDLWPEVSEYPKTYETPFTLANGKPARVFSSWDASTVDTHFRWMKEHGIDGAFMQRFFRVTTTGERRREGRVILGHALTAAERHQRAVAVMYDLSGIAPNGQDCASVIEDWKEIVDELKATSRGREQSYLYHRGKPLVAIWGLGFSGRDYDIRDIGVHKLIDFLRDDPEYGGCSILLGVPTRFRTLRADARADPYLHELMEKADVVLPWTVGRFRTLEGREREKFRSQVRDDLAWCRERNLDYAPCVYPGFSWHNLKGGESALDHIPRQGGRFFWEMIHGSVESGAKMLYVAMFDEIDEGTAIFKLSHDAPVRNPPARFVELGDVPGDHYLWLAGQGGRLLRGENSADPDLYRRTDPKTRDREGLPRRSAKPSPSQP